MDHTLDMWYHDNLRIEYVIWVEKKVRKEYKYNNDLEETIFHYLYRNDVIVISFSNTLTVRCLAQIKCSIECRCDYSDDKL